MPTLSNIRSAPAHGQRCRGGGYLQLWVRGIDRLRVVDASIMSTLLGANTNAPTIMIGERAAEWLANVRA